MQFRRNRTCIDPDHFILPAWPVSNNPWNVGPKLSQAYSMETIPCPNCGSREFVIRAHEFPGASITLQIIHCAKCSAAIGVVGEYEMALKMARAAHPVSTVISDPHATK